MLSIKERADKARDVSRSPKAFNKVIDEYIKKTFTIEIVREIYNLLYTDRYNSQMKVAAIHELLNEKYDIDGKSLADIKTFNTKENVEDGQDRGMLWKLFHNTVRIEAFDVILDDGLYSKKMMRFSNRFHKLIKILLVAQLESRDGTVLAQVIQNKLKGILPDLADDGSGIAETIIMILLYSLKQSPLFNVSIFEDRTTHAKTHRIHFGMKIPDELVIALERVRKRGTNLVAPREYVEGTTYNTTSKRSWKGYRDIPKSKEMAELFNIRNGMPLSFRDGDDFMDRLVSGLGSKFDVDFNEELPASKKWCKKSALNAINEAEEIIDRGNIFYIEHFGDRVQRNYEKSEYFGMGQCSKLRELIELGNKKPLNAEGRMALKLHISCKMGNDKVTEEEALRTYSKYSKEWRDNGDCEYEFSLLRSKRAIGFVVEQDASNSGTQMYTIGSRSLSLAAICGLYGNEERFDAYDLLSQLLNRTLDVDVFNRKNCKGLFMTKLYNAGKQLLLWGGDNTTDADGYVYTYRLAQEVGKTIPLMVTVPDMDEETVWKAFMDAMWYIAPDALKLMDKINSLIDDRLVYEWYMPDGALCQTAMTTIIDRRIEWYDADDKRHSMTYQEKVLLAKAKGAALAPAVVQGMDAYVLRELTRRAKGYGIELDDLIEFGYDVFDIITLHDAFFSHPNDAPVVRRLYREILADCMEMDLMSYVYNQLTTGSKISLQTGDLTKENILESKYALWY